MTYQWTCKMKGDKKIHYRCYAYFDDQNKLKTEELNQYFPYQKVIMPAYEPKKTYDSGGSSNNFYGPPSQGIDYN